MTHSSYNYIVCNSCVTCCLQRAHTQVYHGGQIIRRGNTSERVEGRAVDPGIIMHYIWVGICTLNSKYIPTYTLLEYYNHLLNRSKVNLPTYYFMVPNKTVILTARTL